MCNGENLHAELGGALRQHAFTVTLLVVVPALVGVLLALGQHRVDQARELVGGGGDGLGLVHAGAHPAEVQYFGPLRARPGAVSGSFLGRPMDV